MTTNFTVSLTAYDTKYSRYIFFKVDGKRFGEERTVKLSCNVKYDITVSVKPNGVESLNLQ